MIEVHQHEDGRWFVRTQALADPCGRCIGTGDTRDEALEDAKRDEEPAEFAQAVKFDYAYREAKVRTVSQCGFKPFLHKSRVPLDKVILQKSHGKQLTMFNNECEGMCGV